MSSSYPDEMENITHIRAALDRALKNTIATDPLAALTAIGQTQHDLNASERAAVRAAIQHHSWAEIGAALGVSKQAAHQRLAKAWASQLRDEIKTANNAHKTVMREGTSDEAAAAIAKRDALILEVKNANRRKKAA
jgi:hypothetical protein